MTTQTLTLLASVFSQDDASWFLLHDNQPVSLAQAQPQDLLLKGEVEQFVWWVTDKLPASLRKVLSQDLLQDYVTCYNLQLAPSCNASQALASSSQTPGCAHHVELTLRVTQRVAARLYEALGLQAPVAVKAVDPVPAVCSQVDSCAGTVSPIPDPTGSFEQRFRFWLASVGVQGADADQVCADRYIAGCLRDEDSGDLVRRLPSTLYRIAQGREAQNLLRDPLEMLRLMTFLRT